jgi:hypothetical protein
VGARVGLNAEYKYIYAHIRSRDSSVVTVTVEVRLRIVERLYILHSVKTGSVAHPASYPMGNGSSFPWGKAAKA